MLVTGASGFVGSALLPRLLDAGHRPRALVRDRERFLAALGDRVPVAEVELVVGDALSGAGLARALRDVEVAYYLIHSMEPAASGEPFAERERRAAETFAAAARRAGVERIVYLGGLLPRERSPSPHLASRHSVERVIASAIPDSVALRASIVIGARSRSFRFMVRLVERLPVIALPAWRRFRTQPIDERDIVELLLAAAAAGAAAGGHTLDAVGPETLTYGEMVQRIAELMLVGRPTLGLNVSLTPLTARVAAALAGERAELVLPLMEGLTGDLLATRERAERVLGVQLHSLDAAVEHALADWERSEPLAAR